jgi:hypothetical protein
MLANGAVLDDYGQPIDQHQGRQWDRRPPYGNPDFGYYYEGDEEGEGYW